MDVVNKVLEKAAKEAEHFKPVEVEKPLDLEYDLGRLLAIDNNELDRKELRSNNREFYLKSLARDNTQLLINKIWGLPTERVEDAIVAKLPPATYVLPREKAAPRPKSLTKWQQYAQEKGIRKRKKQKVLWDDVVQQWIPRYGYRHAAAQKQKDWLIEVPTSANPFEDQFAKRVEEKSEKVAKNELKRLRNLAKSKNIKVPTVGLAPTDKPNAGQLTTAATLAKVSTASLGKFQEKLPADKLLKKSGIKRKKHEQPRSAQHEKKANLDLLEKMLTKRPKLNLEKAVNKEIFDTQQEKAAEKRNQKKGGKGKKSQGGRRGGKPNSKGRSTFSGKKGQSTFSGKKGQSTFSGKKGQSTFSGKKGQSTFSGKKGKKKR